MKVNILPSILKRGGGRDKGGTEKEGGRTGRGDIQGGRTYMEWGHTWRGDIQAVVDGWSLSVGARCPCASVIRGQGHRVSAGAHYSWAGSSSSEEDRRCPRWGVIVVCGHGDACPM
jgi:hypothetical protein